jgi:hypothetical protein
MTRYFIEQAPNRFYLKSELDAAKARARSLSKKTSGGVYIIAEEYDPSIRDYQRTGSIAYYNGYIDAREGALA